MFYGVKGISSRIQKAQEVYDTHVKLVADKKRQMEEKRVEGTSKKNGAAEPSGPATTVAYSPTTAPNYYQAGSTTTYQTYPQGYIAQYPQQNIYAQGDPGYGYQNWSTYGTAYNQTWTGAAPQPGAASGYNYMY